MTSLDGAITFAPARSLAVTTRVSVHFAQDLAVMRTVGGGRSDEKLRHVVGLRELCAVLAGKAVSAELGGDDSRIDQVHAKSRLGDFAGIDLDRRLERCLAGGIGAPIG